MLKEAIHWILLFSNIVMPVYMGLFKKGLGFVHVDAFQVVSVYVVTGSHVICALYW